MPPQIDEAVCIRQWDWSETSQTVSLFTRTLGLVRGLAKGSRRPKAPYSGGIELLSRGRAGVIIKQTTELALITEWDLLDPYPVLRRSLEAHSMALYMADLIQHAVTDHDPHTALYDALVSALGLLSEPEARQGALLSLQWSVLVETGYRPRLHEDVLTGESLAPARSHLFSPTLGGLVSSTRDERGHPIHVWRVRAQTIALLRLVDEGRAEVLDAHGQAMRRANRLLAACLRHVFGREPRTLAGVFGPRLPR